MFGRRLTAFAGIIVFVTASIVALWPAAPEAAGIRPEHEFAPGDSSLPEVVEDGVVAGGLTFDSAKPTAEAVAVHDSIVVENIRSVTKGPIKVTPANMTTSQNLGAIGGLDTSIVGEVLADLVVENTGHDRITHIQFACLSCSTSSAFLTSK
jgi:hypothetical protein